MRELLESSDPRAKFAIDLFVYRIGRELGSLAAALGGVDAIVFTAGIGEHAAAVREAVCREAAWLGVDFDSKANGAGGPRISIPSSRVIGVGDSHQRGADDRAAYLGAGEIGCRRR